MTPPGREVIAEANRRLAGILAADVVGYSTMIGADAAGTIGPGAGARSELIEPLANVAWRPTVQDHR